jgi:hypothetical protein
MSADRRLGFTRVRDLLAVGFFALIAGYLLIRLNYGRIPVLPRLAGVVAALVGVAEAVAGWGLRSRIRAASGTGGDRTNGPATRPVPPLTAARAVQAAKATSLAGAAFAGLWLGLLAYVLPAAADVAAAGEDTTTALIGLLGALVMIAGALFLEHCCRAPAEPPGAR